MRKYAMLLTIFVSCICSAELAQIEDTEMSDFSIKAGSVLPVQGVEPVEHKVLTVQDNSASLSTAFQPKFIPLDRVEIRDTGISFILSPMALHVGVN